MLGGAPQQHLRTDGTTASCLGSSCGGEDDAYVACIALLTANSHRGSIHCGPAALAPAAKRRTAISHRDAQRYAGALTTWRGLWDQMKLPRSHLLRGWCRPLGCRGGHLRLRPDRSRTFLPQALSVWVPPEAFVPPGPPGHLGGKRAGLPGCLGESQPGPRSRAMSELESNTEPGCRFGDHLRGEVQRVRE